MNLTDNDYFTNEVRKIVEQAVNYTINVEYDRYNSGLSQERRQNELNTIIDGGFNNIIDAINYYSK